MFEKVSPSHPDKIGDRIAGAIVDYAYSKQADPRIAVEVLIGHGECNIICESSVDIPLDFAQSTVDRITGEQVKVRLTVVPQDVHLADNQKGAIRCGDNGIFKGVPVTFEQSKLTYIARDLYDAFPYDGKYVIDGSRKLIVCQSNATEDEIRRLLSHKGYEFDEIVVNPLGEWTGGTCVDSGATNRKLGSDMADSVTGGGLVGKDASKADVSVNIYAWLKAQQINKPVELFCAIGDETVDGKPYSEIVAIAKQYIHDVGGFEKFAEWGLVR